MCVCVYVYVHRAKWQDIVGDDPDGPVLVLPDDIPDTPPREDNDNKNDNNTAHGTAANGAGGFVPGMQPTAAAAPALAARGGAQGAARALVDTGVVAKQGALSWRERAMQVCVSVYVWVCTFARRVQKR